MLTKPLQVRLDEEDLARLKVISEREDLSVNWLIRKAVKGFLQQAEETKNKSRIPS